MDRQTMFLVVFVVSAMATIALLNRVLLGPDPTRKIPRAEWGAVAVVGAVLIASGLLMLAADGL